MTCLGKSLRINIRNETFSSKSTLIIMMTLFTVNSKGFQNDVIPCHSFSLLLTLHKFSTTILFFRFSRYFTLQKWPQINFCSGLVCATVGHVFACKLQFYAIWESWKIRDCIFSIWKVAYNFHPGFIKWLSKVLAKISSYCHFTFI